MIYQYITPDPVLQEFVKDFLIAHFVFEKKEQIPFKSFSPRPEQALTFLPKGKLLMTNLHNGQSHYAPALSICGQQVSRYNFYLPHEFLMFRVNFQLGALYRLLQIPLLEFTDNWFDADAVMNWEFREVNERLCNCQDYLEMISIVQGYLTAKIRQLKSEVNPIDRIASTILKNPSMFSLDWLAGEACLCNRQLNRKFVERIGVGPKLFSRIVRFYKAYKYKEAHPAEPWLSVALEFGYSDYQHMVKDFQKFAFVTPNIWIDQDYQSPERLLHLAQ